MFLKKKKIIPRIERPIKLFNWESKSHIFSQEWIIENFYHIVKYYILKIVCFPNQKYFWWNLSASACIICFNETLIFGKRFNRELSVTCTKFSWNGFNNNGIFHSYRVVESRKAFFSNSVEGVLGVVRNQEKAPYVRVCCIFIFYQPEFSKLT